jgi:hypothetical protein
MDNLVLSNKQIIPDDDLIFSIIRDRKKLWQSIMTHINNNYAGSSGEWNYYNDGKKWLFKLGYKKKTIFWIGILDDTFRVTFWFADKAQQLINESDVEDKIKEEFKSARKYGAVRAVSVIMNDQTDVDNVLKLIAIKISLK